MNTSEHDLPYKRVVGFTRKEGEKVQYWYEDTLPNGEVHYLLYADGTGYDCALRKERVADRDWFVQFIKERAEAFASIPPSLNVFEEANKIIYGDREETYGKPSKNLSHIASQWSLYLIQKYGIKIVLSPEDVCWMMADLKKARQMNSAKRDNLVDAIGYIGLVSRLDE